MNSTDLQDYWNNRFKSYGHTGWKIPELHAYDQRVRLKTVIKFLAQTGFLIDESKNILDIGCGSGDFVLEFAKRKANVVGFDISDDLVEQTQKRFEPYKNVKIFCSSVENINLPAQSIDLITSITVLQHIPSDEQLLQALNLFFAILKPDGYILLLESVFSEPEKYQQDKLFYLQKRTKVEWLESFHNAKFTLVREESYPQFALTGLRYFKRIMDLVKPKDHTNNSSELKPNHSNGFYSHLIKVFLALFTPVDLWLAVPFPKQHAQQRIFLLRKSI